MSVCVCVSVCVRLCIKMVLNMILCVEAICFLGTIQYYVVKFSYPPHPSYHYYYYSTENNNCHKFMKWKLTLFNFLSLSFVIRFVSWSSTLHVLYITYSYCRSSVYCVLGCLPKNSSWVELFLVPFSLYSYISTQSK